MTIFKTYTLACFNVIFRFPLKWLIITVKQDGTKFYNHTGGDCFVSSNSGDTVAQYGQGVLRNITYNRKHITVASLYITNPDKWYIYNTIIDGNQLGKLRNYEWRIGCSSNKWIYNKKQ
ncbi:MAG: hypothetical protein R2750_07640 [Bacteroidales bacterium]